MMQNGSDGERHSPPCVHEPCTALPGGLHARALCAHAGGATMTDASGTQLDPALAVGLPTSRSTVQSPVETHPLSCTGGPHATVQAVSEKNVTIGGSHPIPCGTEQLHPHWAAPPSRAALPSNALCAWKPCESHVDRLPNAPLSSE